jgi:Condensation domain
MPTNTLQPIESADPVLLGPVESYFWRYDKDLSGAGRIIVLLRLDGCIEADLLTAALDRLQRRHPKLRASIASGADGLLRYQFDRIPPPIPFEIIDCYEAETSWRETTRRLLEMDLPPGGPLAAFTVLRDRSRNRSEVFLTAPHAISDGMSGIVIMDELLTEYSKVEANPDLPPSPALPAVSPSRAKPSGGWRRNVRLLRRFVQLQREERRSPVTLLPESRDIPSCSQWMHWVFSREETLRLVRRCRQERASLNGVLVAAACCGLRDCLPGPEVTFKWQLPFNVRESLEGPSGPITAQDLGCFIANMNGLVKISAPQPFWDVARRAHQDLQLFIEEGGPSFGYNVASFLYGLKVATNRLFRRPLPKTEPSPLRETLLASNYGVLSMRDVYGSLRPQECTLIFKNEMTGPSLVMEGLVLGQRLNIGFSANDLNPTLWDQLHVAVRRHLDAAVSASTAVTDNQAAGHRMSVAAHE